MTLLCLFPFSPPAGAATMPSSSPSIETFTLPNGLKVILAPDRSVPVAAVAMIVDVGSRRETPGRSGFAHLFEHLMFQGSAHAPKGAFDKLLESHGGADNASTHADYTYYFTIIPSNAIPISLWLEADRLSALAITREALENQISVVKEEKRLRIDNEPYGPLIYDEITARSFSNWENAHSTMGSFKDLESASLENVRDFFKTYYSPGNITLALAGDFDTAEARRWIEKYLAWIPARPLPAPVDTAEPRAAAPARAEITDAHANLPALALAWRDMPRRGAEPDFYALSLMDGILFEGKSSRLYQVLVKEKQAAVYVGGHLGWPSSDFSDFKAPGLFTAFIVHKAEHSPDEIKALVDGAIRDVASRGVPEGELDRVKVKFRSDWIRDRQTTLGRAESFLKASLFDRDPSADGRELAKYMSVMPADIRGAAAKYLADPDRLSFIAVRPGPRPERGQGRDPTAPVPSGETRKKPGPAAKENPGPRFPAYMAKPPSVGPVRPYEPPRRIRYKLANGLEVLLVEDHRYPLVTARLAVRRGASILPAKEAGAMDALADLLTEGTKTRTAKQISDEAESLGGEIEASAGQDAIVLRASALSENAGRMLGLLRDVALNADFPPDEVALRKHNMLEELKVSRADPSFLSSVAFFKKLYGNHPYAITAPTEESIRDMRRERFEDLHRRLFSPEISFLVLVGDVRPEDAKAAIESDFGEWKAQGAAPAEPAGKTPKEDGRRVFVVDRPGSSQTSIHMGSIALTRKNPDYFKLLVLNTILGGSFGSRLVSDIRERRGFAYGISSLIQAQKEEGAFVLATNVRTEVTKPALEAILQDMEAIREKGVTEEELTQAKNVLAGQFVRSLETQGGVANQFLNALSYDLPSDWLETFVPRVLAVTREDVLEAAKKYVRPGSLVIAAVGDASAIKTSLASFSREPIQTVDQNGD